MPSSVIYRVTTSNSKGGESAKNRSSVMLLGPSAQLPFADSFAGAFGPTLVLSPPTAFIHSVPLL